MAGHPGIKADVTTHAGTAGLGVRNLARVPGTALVGRTDRSNTGDALLYQYVQYVEPVEIPGWPIDVAADLRVAIGRGVGLAADIRAVVSRCTATSTDLRLVVVHPVSVSVDTRFAVWHSISMDADIALVIRRMIELTPPVPVSSDHILEFLGKGLRFPFTFQRRSGGAQISTATSSDHAHIHESIRQILGTRKGERFMRPEFGTRLHELVFEPNDSVLYGLLRHEVMDALERWEPRVVVEDVVVAPDESDEHLVRVDIRYRLISSQTFGNLVYPFYRELE